MSPKMGRPISDNPRHERVELKMTKDELAQLDYCCEASEKSRAAIIREGIGIIYARLTKHKK